jgi:hypothetical protein
VSRTAPTGTPAVFVDSEFVVTSSVTPRASARWWRCRRRFPNGGNFLHPGWNDAFLRLQPLRQPLSVATVAATLRATAYRADFSLSREMDPITITIVPAFHREGDHGGRRKRVVDAAMAAYLRQHGK